MTLFSDTNYVRSGFNATYTIERCPGSCSGHGACVHNQCQCESGWLGDDCSRAACPAACGAHGSCRQAPYPHCVCQPGWTGAGCSEAVRDDVWFVESAPEPSIFQPRAEHTTVLLADGNTALTFGGYSLSHTFASLLAYDFEVCVWGWVGLGRGQQGHASASGW